MTNVLVILLIWVVLVVGGMIVYYGYTRWMPQSVRDVFSGWKTKVLGAVVAISPDVLHVLSLIQIIGADWEMSESTAWIMRIVGTTVTVLRFITDREQT